jgi:hypothetical protein
MSGAAFYRQSRWKREARRAGLRLEVATGGGGDELKKLGGDRGAGGRRCSAARRRSTQARHQQRAKAVGEQGDHVGEGENRRWAPATKGGSLRRRQGARRQRRGGRGARKKKGERIERGLFCNIREKQGPH